MDDLLANAFTSDDLIVMRMGSQLSFCAKDIRRLLLERLYTGVQSMYKYSLVLIIQCGRYNDSMGGEGKIHAALNIVCLITFPEVMGLSPLVLDGAYLRSVGMSFFAQLFPTLSVSPLYLSRVVDDENDIVAWVTSDEALESVFVDNEHSRMQCHRLNVLEGEAIDFRRIYKVVRPIHPQYSPEIIAVDTYGRVPPNAKAVAAPNVSKTTTTDQIIRSTESLPVVIPPPQNQRDFHEPMTSSYSDTADNAHKEVAVEAEAIVTSSHDVVSSNASRVLRKLGARVQEITNSSGTSIQHFLDMSSSGQLWRSSSSQWFGMAPFGSTLRNTHGHDENVDTDDIDAQAPTMLHRTHTPPNPKQDCSMQNREDHAHPDVQAVTVAAAAAPRISFPRDTSSVCHRQQQRPRLLSASTSSVQHPMAFYISTSWHVEADRLSASLQLPRDNDMNDNHENRNNDDHNDQGHEHARLETGTSRPPQQPSSHQPTEDAGSFVWI
jgi:hypothetical protein